jgi:tRNA A-37 threonylcarbamoyl transferase component Bud32
VARTPPKGTPLDQLLARAAIADVPKPIARAATEALGPDSQDDVWSDFTRTNEGPEPTSIYDRYQILEAIGAGGSAAIHRGRDRKTGTDVAIKLLYPEELESRHWRRRLIRELEALRRLRHPNVLQVHDFGLTADRQPMIVFELIQGESLRDLSIRSGKLPPEQVIELAIQIASGLEAVHAAGIVHRDIKLANLMLTKFGEVKIVDFGLVRFGGNELTRVTVAGAILGTPETIAPEQIIDASKAGPPADMYAVGVCLYRLLQGVAPFVGSVEAVLVQHTNSKVPELPDNLGLGPLIRALLSKRPEKRPTASKLRRTLLGETGMSERAVLGVGLVAASMIAVIAGVVSFSAYEPEPEPLARAVEVPAPAEVEVSPRVAPAPTAEPTSSAEAPPVVEPIVEPVAQPTVPGVVPIEDLQDPPTRGPRPRAPSKKADPPVPEALQPGRLEAALRPKLAQAGLGLDDLEWLAPGNWSSAKSARRGRDLARLDAAQKEIEAAIGRPIDDDTVKSALDRALSAIRAASLEAEQLSKLEERYFELRREITGARAATRNQRIDLIRQARRLELAARR